MGTNTNIGQKQAVTVFGNPESFKKLIDNHGQLCKVKQSIVCPCVADNNGSADLYCTICEGRGFIYTYQRRFTVVDENSNTCDNEVYPYWQPVLSVIKVQNVTSQVQGGITDLEVSSFDENTIYLASGTTTYEKKRVTYEFDGWTYVEKDKLVVDVSNGLMYPTETLYDAGYQSSNPLDASADIAKMIKIWNDDTGVEITDYTIDGNSIHTYETIEADKMYAEYYYSDLTQVITNDIATRNTNEVFTHDLAAGEVRMAFYPFWELTRGDIIVISATVLYKNETLTHIGNADQLWEIEPYDISDVIIDSDGNQYSIDTDYILQGRHIKWVSTGSKPADNKTISVRYGYKPSFIIFEDNPQPNNLENKQYPKTVLAKSWSKMDKEGVAKLILG
jgi:hypothetical protein